MESPPDFELRDKDCKHIMAVKLYADRQARGVEQDTTNVEPSPRADKHWFLGKP
jgi:hypothetical protein